MDNGVKTVSELVEEIYGIMPHGLSSRQLKEYGLEASPERAQALALELLYLNLFWIDAACEALLTAVERTFLRAALRQRLESVWSTELGLPPERRAGYEAEAEARRRDYARIVGEGGDPVAVMSEAAGLLEMSRLVSGEERMNVLALFIDLVPVETYGELMEDISLAEG